MVWKVGVSSPLINTSIFMNGWNNQECLWHERPGQWEAGLDLLERWAVLVGLPSTVLGWPKKSSAAPANNEIWWQHKKQAESSALSSKLEKKLSKGKRGWGRQWFHTTSGQNHNFLMQQYTVSELLSQTKYPKPYRRSEKCKEQAATFGNSVLPRGTHCSRGSPNKSSLNSRAAQRGPQCGCNASHNAFPRLTYGWKKHLDKKKDEAKDVDTVIVG